MTNRNKIIKFCEDYLKVKDFEDYCVNGLQVGGDLNVKKIITGVSLSQKLIKKAIEEKAQMIMVHHGMFDNQLGKPPQIKGVLKNRLKLLLENNISLAGFHLPLDAHKTIGNNASICKILGIKNIKPVYVGFIGDLENKVDINKFLELVKKNIKKDPYSILAGPKKIKKVGVISGGASPEYKLAKELGADVYICGDVREEIVRAVEEDEINFINAGHYNTEVFGIRNLGNLVKNKFKIEVKFIDVHSDV
ncbi:Nif3-like dinuclear metal center hexameric protein [bacterium]|nr:Nif3-like dinuclear metal center hexameric protein [bacterium]